MILCDTGPLIALIDRKDPYHQQCLAALPGLGNEQLITVLPCVTEAMYLLFRAGGLAAQEELWQFIDDQLIEVGALDDTELRVMRELMRRFEDSPMDFADAAIMALADVVQADAVFTLDRHFYAYRTLGGRALRVIP